MADDPLAFDTEKCPVDPVVRIPPCENLLVDIRVPDAPEDMPDCPIDPLTVDPEPPCPTIDPEFATSASGSTGNDGLNYGGSYVTNPPALRYGFVKGNCCDFDLQIEIDVPCPALTPDSRTKNPPFVPTANRVTFGFTKNLETCEFDLDIDLEIHCPRLTPLAGNSDSVFPGSIRFTDDDSRIQYAFAKAEDTCDYDLDIDIEVHCPLFTPGTPTTVSFADDTGTLTYRVTRDGATCNYDLTIDVDFPYPCPNVLPTSTTFVYLYTAGGVQGYVSWRFDKSGTCDWTLTLDAALGCPDFTPAEETFVYGYIGYGGVQSFVSYYFVRDGTNCDWELLVDFTVACVSMLPVVETFVYGYTANGVQSFVSYYFVKGTNCEWTLIVDFEVACVYLEPQTPTYVYLYTAQGVQGYISYYFVKDLVYCEYTLVVDALVPCPYIRPQTATFAYYSYPNGQQSYIQYHFVKSPTECQYTLSVEFALACPTVTHFLDYGIHTIPCSESASMVFNITTNPDDCLEWHWYLHLWIPNNCGTQALCTQIAGCNAVTNPAPMVMGAPGATFEAPIAALPTGDADLFNYAAAVPVFSPDYRIEDVMVLQGPWQPGEATVARTPMDAGFLSMVAPDSIEVVGLVPDRPALTGAWVDGTDVVVGITASAAPVNKVVLRVSGRNKDKPGRYAGLTDKQLLEVELAEARRFEENPY